MKTITNITEIVIALILLALCSFLLASLANGLAQILSNGVCSDAFYTGIGWVVGTVCFFVIGSELRPISK